MTGPIPASPPAGDTEFDLRRIPFARYLGNRVRSAKGLQKLIRGYFGFPKVRVLQFTPAWVDIPVQTRLGSSATVLGTSSRLGDRMEDVLSRFTVQIGPLPTAWFNRFLPFSKALVAQYAKGGHATDDGEVSSSLLRIASLFPFPKLLDY